MATLDDINKSIQELKVGPGPEPEPKKHAGVEALRMGEGNIFQVAKQRYDDTASAQHFDRFSKVLGHQMGEAAITLSELPAQTAGLVQEKQAVLDKHIGRKAQEVIKAVAPPQVQGILQATSLIRDITSAIVEKDPEAQKFIEQVRSGLDPEEGTILARYEDEVKRILGMTEEKAAIVREYAQAKPLEAENLYEGIMDIGKLLTANANIFAMMTIPGGVGTAGVISDVRSNFSQAIHDTLAEQDIEYKPEDYYDVLDTVGAAVGGIYFAVGKGVTLASAAGRSQVKNVIMNKFGGTLTERAVASATSKILDPVATGATVGGVALLEDEAVNMVLWDMERKTGQEIDKIKFADTWEKTKEAATSGFFMGLGTSVAGLPVEIRERMQEREYYSYLGKDFDWGFPKTETKAPPRKGSKYEIAPIKPNEAMTNAEKVEHSAYMQADVAHINDQAISTADASMRENLRNIPYIDFLDMAQDFGMTVGLSREQAIDHMMADPTRLEAYGHRINAVVEPIIEEAPVSNFTKNMYKWISQGRVTENNIIALKGIFEQAAWDAGYDTADQLFDELVALNGDETFIDFDSIFEPKYEQVDAQIASSTIASSAKGTLLTEEQSTAYAEILPEIIASTRQIAIQNTKVANNLSGVAQRRLQPFLYLAHLAADSPTINLLRDFAGSPEAIKQASKLPNLTNAQKRLVALAQQEQGNHIPAKSFINLIEAAHAESGDLYNRVSKLNEYNPNSEEYHIFQRILLRGVIPSVVSRAGGTIHNNQVYKETGSSFPTGNKSGMGVGVSDPKPGTATHEAGHGMFFNTQYDQDIFEGYIATLTPQATKQLEIMGRKYYNTYPYEGVGSPGDKHVASIFKHHNPGVRALTEMISMYISNDYNIPNADTEAINAEFSSFLETNLPDLLPLVDAMEDYNQVMMEKTKGGTIFYQLDRDTMDQRASTAAKGAKFVTDLFATGDITSLSHEFMHVLTPFLKPELLDATSREYIARFHGGDSLSREMLDSIWSNWLKDPDSIKSLTPDQAQLFAGLQEEVALSLEQYLLTQTSPIKSLTPVFENFRQEFKEYYGGLRKSKADIKISYELATAFDKMFAGERALIRLEPRTVKIGGKSYEIHQTRIKNTKHRNLLKYLKQAYSKEGGMHGQMEEYTRTMLGYVPAGVQVYINSIASTKDSLAVVNMVDKILLGKEVAIRKKRISSIKETAKDLLASEVDLEVKAQAKAILDDVALIKPTKKKLQRFNELEALLAYSVKNRDIPKELYDISKRDLKLLRDMNKRSVYNLTTVELGTLEFTLDTLGKWYTKNAEALTKDRIETQMVLSDTVSHELSSSWRGHGKRGDKNLRTTSKARRFATIVGGPPTHQLVNMENIANSLASHIETEEFSVMFDNLKQGYKDMFGQLQGWQDMFSEITKDVDFKIVSRTYGDSQTKLIKVKMYEETESAQLVRDHKTGELTREVSINQKPVDVEFSIGELMMLYGQSLNDNGMRHLLSGVVPAQYKDVRVTTNETGWSTIFDQLPQEYRAMTYDIVKIYAGHIGPAIDAVSQKVIGRKIAQEINYLPMFLQYYGRQNMEVLNLSQLDAASKHFTIELLQNLGFTQGRTGSKLPFNVVDIFEGVSHNLRDVSRYTGLYIPLTRIKATLLSDAGAGSGGNYNTLGRIMGTNQREEFHKFIRTLESAPVDSTDLARFAAKGARLTQGGVLALSIPIATYQVLSGPTGAALAGIPTKYILRAIGPKKITQFKEVVAKHSMAEMSDMSPSMRERFSDIVIPGMVDNSMGFYVDATFRQAQKGAARGILDIRTGMDVLRVIGNIQHNEKFLIRFMDGVAISKLLEMVEYEGEAHGWPREKVITRWEDVVNRTQPTRLALYQSNILATMTPLQKTIFGMFLSQPDQYNGQVQRAVGDVENTLHQDGIDPKQKKAQLKDALKRILIARILAQVLFSAVKVAFSRLGRDEREKEDMGYFEELFYTSMATIVGGSQYVFGSVISSIMNKVLKGYPVDTWGYMPLEVGKGALDDTLAAYKEIERGDYKKAGGHIIDAGSKAIQVLGSGAENVKRFITKTHKEFKEN